MPTYRSEWNGPPAPLVDMKVQWNGREEPVTGILDTGADLTQIPDVVARALRLRRIGDQTSRNADGRSRVLPLYAADLEFEGFRFPSVPVVGSPLPIALVGRDLLNQLRAEFDGPGLAFSLSRPGTV